MHQPTAYKLVFAGPFGVGKTTAIDTLSEIPPVETEASATEGASPEKLTTTVAMDYGLLTLEDGSTLHLYGTPGQKRFDFMWDVLMEGCVGLCILLDHSKQNPLNDLNYYLDHFLAIKNVTTVIGITRTEGDSDDALASYLEVLQGRGIFLPVLTVDLRIPTDVVLLIETLVSLIPYQEA